jgi:outer membrane protein TolC
LAGHPVEAQGRPALPQADRKLPEIERLYEAALSRNPGLRALRAQAEAADERVEAARAEGRPRISGELEASAYARNLNSNDEWRAGVNVEVPLYTGGLVSAVVSQRQAEVHEARARLRQGEMELRQAILDLWLQLQMLQVQRDEASALRDYRELYLDRSRTKYEQEVTSDLGDAMVLLSEAELADARARFQTALTWERIDALTGGAMALEITGKNEKN